MSSQTELNAIRKLNIEFLTDLMPKGKLEALTRLLQVDKSLDMQIRNNYVNIYYRGGNLLKIARKTKSSDYLCIFDQDGIDGDKGYKTGIMKFYEDAKLSSDPCVQIKTFKGPADVEHWIHNILPRQKMMMDLHKSCWGERQHQQYIVNSNNYGKESNKTDWFLLDLEYQVDLRGISFGKKSTKIDLIGIDCKRKKDAKWALIEVKTGEKAIVGKSGLEAHLRINLHLANDKVWVDETTMSLNKILEQKKKLKLAKGIATSSVSNDTPYIIFILTELKPGEKGFIGLLMDIKKRYPEALPILRFFVSSLMGFGLYNQMLLDTDSLISLLQNRGWFQSGSNSKASRRPLP